MRLRPPKWLYRSWFYFRVGYGTYISLPIGVASSLVVLYQLAVIRNKYLAPLFPSLTIFTVTVLIVFIPICISVGLYHMKKTGAFAADASVQTESNPYVYRIIPGKEQEVFLPLWVMTLRALGKVLDQQGAMTEQERDELRNMLQKANALLEGKPVGLPTRAARIRSRPKPTS